MAKFQTVAEILAFRQLEEETVSGVPRYKSGQHKARIVGAMGQVTYVDVAGNLVMIAVVKREGEWFMAAPSGLRMSHFSVEVVPFPRSFRLTTDMLKCLDQAEEESTKKKAKKK